LQCRSELISVFTKLISVFGIRFRSGKTLRLTSIDNVGNHKNRTSVWGPPIKPTSKKRSSLFFVAVQRCPMMESPFFLQDEVNEISRVCDLTRSRLEKRGLFPKRVRIGARKVAWRKTEIEEWARDPEGWAKRHSEQSERAIG